MKLKIRLILITISLCFLVISQRSSAQPNEQMVADNKLKAVFLYHFTKYIQWPREEKSKPFEMGLVGKSDIYPFLKEIADKKRINDREIIVHQWPNIQSITPCQMLFVCASHKSFLPLISQWARDKGVLTVAGFDGAIESGAAINFITLEGKMKFQINQLLLEKQGFHVSSHLLKLAILVKFQRSQEQ